MANKDPLPSLVCSIAGYYPLDVGVTWIREELGGIPAQVSGASFSSLRQSTMGTYSISSTVMADPGPTGATYTCQVAHVSLEEPLTTSMRVLPNPGTGGVLSPPLSVFRLGLPCLQVIFGCVLFSCVSSVPPSAHSLSYLYLSQSGILYHYESPASK